MEEVSGGAAVPCTIPQAVALSQHRGRGNALAAMESVRCLGEVASGEGRGGPSLAVEQVSAATCRWAGRA